DANGNNVIDAGDLVAEAAFPRAPDGIAANLPAGTAFVRVIPGGGVASTRYRLTLASGPQDFAGDTTSAARDLGTPLGTNTFQDFLGAFDTDDFYRVTLADGGPFAFRSTLTPNDPAANFRTELFRDANGNGLVDSGERITSNAGAGPRTISRVLSDPGTYFVRASRVSGDSTYALALTL